MKKEVNVKTMSFEVSVGNITGTIKVLIVPGVNRILLVPSDELRENFSCEECDELVRQFREKLSGVFDMKMLI